MPIVSASGGSVSMCLPALTVGSVVRRVEQWLGRGGTAESLAGIRKGIRYEAWVRKEIIAAVSGNAILSRARAAENALKPSDHSVGDIDLLVVLGQLLLVGEIKCLLTPADPIEQNDYIEKLRKAAEQASRKVKWINDHRHLASEVLEVPVERVSSCQIVPLIVVNQGFGFSLEIGGCNVVDFHYLRNYLADNSIVVNAAVRAADGAMLMRSQTFYNSETEAAHRLVSLITDPPVLRRYIDRVLWHDIPFPTASGEPFIIEGTTISKSNPQLDLDREFIKTHLAGNPRVQRR